MNKKIYQTLLAYSFAGMACCTLFSCNRYYYQPNSVNVPSLSDAGDVHVVANGSFGADRIDDTKSRTRVLNLQAAASPVNHLGIIGGYTNYNYHIRENPDPASGNVNASANLWEIGVGGYYTAAENRRGMKLVTDIYVGLGTASLKSDISANATKYFLQPGIGLKSPYFDAFFNLRFSGIKYTDFNALGRDDQYLKDKNLINYEGKRFDNETYVFVEPAFTVRGGYRFIKCQMQLTLSQALSNVDWNHNEALFTVGIYFGLEDLLNMPAPGASDRRRDRERRTE